ncbi:MAG: sodium:calcium antiporter [Candidatus Aenigmatarchaeota archaeon]
MILSLLTLVAGMALLVGGAHFLTEYASQLTKRWAISEFAVGITFVALFTSLPEISVAVISGVTNMLNPATAAMDIATGTIVGSNIVNICIVLGLASLMSSVKMSKKYIKSEYFLLILTVVTSIALVLGMGVIEGLIIMALLVAYFIYMVRTPHDGPVQVVERAYYRFFSKDNFVGLLLAVAGAIGLFVGSFLTVNGVLEISAALAIPEFLIALIVVSIGTSLPEITASLMASAKNMSALSFGNVIGSNIFNIAGLAVASLFSAIPTAEALTRINLPFLLLVTAALVLLSRIRKKIHWKEGAVLLGVYVIFVVLQLF